MLEFSSSDILQMNVIFGFILGSCFAFVVCAVIEYTEFFKARKRKKENKE